MDNTSVRDLIHMAETIPSGFLLLRPMENDFYMQAINQKLARMCDYENKEEMMKATGGMCRQLIHAWDYPSMIRELKKDLLLKDDSESFGRHYFHLRLKNGDYVDAEGVEMTMTDPEWGRVLAINVVKEQNRETRNSYDDVTSLPHAGHLCHWIDQNGAEAGGVKVTSTICLNITSFRALNEAGGIQEGDAFLKEFGRLLVRVFETRLICRNFADYFTIFYMGEKIPEKLEILQKELQNLRKEFHLGIEAGIYIWHHKVLAEESINHAESALRSIERGQNPPYCIYTDEFATKEQKKHYIETHFDEALEKGWIEVWMQPVVRSLTGKIAGFEALSRWRDPVYGMISPGEFVPVLERTYQSKKLAAFVIEDVAKKISDFRNQMHRICAPVSLNLSRRDFDSFDPSEAIAEAVEKYGLDHDQISAEITESTVMENPQKVREVTGHLHENGFRVWMDDFGSAYSSLNVLKNFSFDLIKLDMAFLHNLNNKGRTIIRDCISMAKNVGILTLCEGVENEEQLTFLRDAGCDFIQGFYYSRPLPAEEIRQKIMEGTFVLEDKNEAGIFDAMSPMPFMQMSSWCLCYADHGRIQTIYQSRNFREKIRDRHLIQIPDNGLLSPDGAGMMPGLYESMNRASRSAETTMEEYRDGSDLYEICSRPLSWLEKERGMGIATIRRKHEDAGLPFEEEGRILNAYAEDPIPFFICQLLPGSTPDQDDVEYLYCNEAYCHLLGKRRTEIIGRKFRSISMTTIDDSWVSIIAKCVWSQRKLVGRKFSAQNLHMLEYLAVPMERKGCVAFSLTIDDGSIDYDNQMGSAVPDDDNTIMDAAVTNAISIEDPHQAVQTLLTNIGKDLHADRTCIFTFEKDGSLRIAYEWCAEGVESEMDLHQGISHDVYEKEWSSLMEHHQNIVIRNMDEYAKINPGMAALLRERKIEHLAAVPVFLQGKLIGFAGIDNPPLSSISGIERHLEIFARYLSAFLLRCSRWQK